jgi:hypothetical protein
LVADSRNEIERHRAAAQREADELTKQTESISSHVAQIRQLLGTQLAVDGKPAKPAKPAVGSGQPSPAEAAPEPLPHTAATRVTASRARRARI